MAWVRTWCRVQILCTQASFRQGHRAVLRHTLGKKKIKMVYAPAGSGETTHNIPTPQADQLCFCITDADVLTLTDYAIKIEDHYSERCRAAQAYGHRMGSRWS